MYPLFDFLLHVGAPNVARPRSNGRSLHIAIARMHPIQAPDSQKNVPSRALSPIFRREPMFRLPMRPAYSPFCREAAKITLRPPYGLVEPAISTIAPDLYGFPERREAPVRYRRLPTGRCSERDYALCRGSAVFPAAPHSPCAPWPPAP